MTGRKKKSNFRKIWNKLVVPHPTILNNLWKVVEKYSEMQLEEIGRGNIQLEDPCVLRSYEKLYRPNSGKA